MRTLPSLFLHRRPLLTFACVLGLAAATAAPSIAHAQVSDAERAAARDLFKQGDELQRAGKSADALDKFQRAQQVIQAPTNVLRIAECQAALGKLVESTESYHVVVRWALAPGAPGAFQSAIDQAKGELAQIEPRVPHLLVQVMPSGVANEGLVIDGTAVPSALLGEPVPLDPGEHKIQVNATGYVSPEQTVTLRERETKTLAVELHATAASIAPAPAPGSTPPPPPAYGSSSAAEPAAPPPFEPPAAPQRKPSRTGILIGGHLGFEIPTGNIPLAAQGGLAPSAAASDISGPGLAFALDGGVRFLRNWYVGLTLEHAQLPTGKNPSSVGADPTSLASNTTSLGVVGAFISNPDKVSFFGEVGLTGRWYNFWWSGQPTQSYTSGELLLGAGLWIPAGRSLRLLPLATVGIGSFNPPDQGSPNSDGSQGHAFVMLGVEGFYNLDL